MASRREVPRQGERTGGFSEGCIERLQSLERVTILNCRRRKRGVGRFDVRIYSLHIRRAVENGDSKAIILGKKLGSYGSNMTGKLAASLERPNLAADTRPD
jgi:hypothetical protein